MRRLRVFAVLLLFGSLLLLSSCSLDAVAKFANQSSQALAQGPAILKDIEASCIRRQLSQQPYYGLDQAELAAQAQANAATSCATFSNSTPALLVASKTLTDYFTAISQLASTGKTSAGKNADSDKQAASKAARTPESQTLMKSAGSIIDVIGKLASEAYRDKHLQADLKKVAPDVDAVLKALKTAGDDDYNRTLDSEQLTYERQFSVSLQDLGAPGAGDPPQVKLIRILAKNNESSQAEIIAAKHAAAKAYGDAVDKIISGHDALLAHSGKLDAKDVPSLIQPYTDEVSKLVPLISKVF
jgi:hypothetical protein